MSKFIDIAINLALENIEEGGSPYGSVVVKDGEIVGRGVNTIHLSPDVSGHAELLAIREAQKNLARIDLSDCTIYASGHPCPMCFGAIALSGIKKLVYANSLEEAAEASGNTKSLDIYEYLKGKQESLELEVEHIPINNEAFNPMKVWGKKKEEK